MRFIDKTNCKSALEAGVSRDVETLGPLTRTATRIAEENGLGLLLRRDGVYRIIRASGLGSPFEDDWCLSLEEVDNFFKNLSEKKKK